LEPGKLVLRQPMLGAPDLFVLDKILVLHNNSIAYCGG
jgi:hypothetical protein